MSTRKKTTKPLSTEAEKKLKYIAMVKAVREWIAVEHPNPLPDRVDVCLYDDMGSGETIACFHADATSSYMIGDMMAMGE